MERRRSKQWKLMPCSGQKSSGNGSFSCLRQCHSAVRGSANFGLKYVIFRSFFRELHPEFQEFTSPWGFFTPSGPLTRDWRLRRRRLRRRVARFAGGGGCAAECACRRMAPLSRGEGGFAAGVECTFLFLFVQKFLTQVGEFI